MCFVCFFYFGYFLFFDGVLVVLGFVVVVVCGVFLGLGMIFFGWVFVGWVFLCVVVVCGRCFVLSFYVVVFVVFEVLF